MTISQIPTVSKEITVDRVGNPFDAQTLQERTGHFFHLHDKFSDTESLRQLAHLTMSKSSDADNLSHCSSAYHNDRAGSSYSGDEGSTGPTRKTYPAYAFAAASPLIGLPESSQLGWGHWFTLRDLELATNRFSKENVIGEGGYGIVYRGRLMNGSEVAVKKLLNNLMLVYEYVNNGNLEQWLHGAMRQHGILSWENRMKVILSTAKAEIGKTSLAFYSQVNLVEWLKMMVGNRRAEEVVDPNLEVKPAIRALKRTLLVALRCVDPDSDKRPKMGQVVRMLEADELPYREVITFLLVLLLTPFERILCKL
ncbi:hypothetical protein B296_00018503 [Ensete ventricosum]|uniref:Protein kinase domain-containing protein n=1 Tax=Ensete ventricosum TaxID=4639 RepID=A0A426Y6R6_ENSVE|nr:hypothetical protein B296_00018503 [Ensete ventricosum]